jgi:hypothetical protein
MVMPALRKFKKFIDKACEDQGSWFWGKKKPPKPRGKKTTTNPWD